MLGSLFYRNKQRENSIVCVCSAGVGPNLLPNLPEYWLTQSFLWQKKSFLALMMDFLCQNIRDCYLVKKDQNIEAGETIIAGSKYHFGPSKSPRPTFLSMSISLPAFLSTFLPTSLATSLPPLITKSIDSTGGGKPVVPRPSAVTPPCTSFFTTPLSLSSSSAS